MSPTQVPLIQLADITVTTGAPMIKNEEGFLSGIVYVDTTSKDMGGYVAAARKAVAQQVKLPAGYQLVWSGQYEYLLRVNERLRTVVPITLFVVALLLIGSVIVEDSGEREGKRIDWIGVLLSAIGLFFIVFGIIESSTYGWIRARKPFPLWQPDDLSIALPSVVFGAVVLALFGIWEYRIERRGGTPAGPARTPAKSESPAEPTTLIAAQSLAWGTRNGFDGAAFLIAGVLIVVSALIIAFGTPRTTADALPL